MNLEQKTNKTLSNQNLNKKFNVKLSSVQTRKPPEIRQTLTSKYRMLKANPLLQYELEGKDLTELLNKDRRFSLAKLSNIQSKSSNVTLNSTSTASNKPKTFVRKETNNFSMKSKQSINNSGSASSKTGTVSNVNNKSHQGTSKQPERKCNEFKKPDIKIKPPVSKPGHSKTDNKANINNAKNSKKPVPIRRSLSADHFLKKQRQSILLANNKFSKLQSNKSFQNINPNRSKPQTIEQIKFKSPSAYARRSVISSDTPNRSQNRSSMMTRNNVFVSGPPLHDLEKRLNDWLRKRGKSVTSFHHLKCFGLQNTVDEENKENVEVLEDLNKGSYEDLNITVTVDKPKIVGIAEGLRKENLKVKDALMDLHKLIIEGYDSKQCEVWLKLIHQKYKDIQEESEYWECRAAIEQTRGDITSAVECYKTAIVHGAEVEAVDKSLDYLLQKFSLLNINTTEKDNNKKNNQKIMQDARNIFKSSIIQFAVQERKLKKKPQKEKEPVKTFIATPVRRSTRLSRGAYSCTPGVKIYSTLLELDSPIKEAISFRCNTAL